MVLVRTRGLLLHDVFIVCICTVSSLGIRWCAGNVVALRRSNACWYNFGIPVMVLFIGLGLMFTSPAFVVNFSKYVESC